MTRSPYTILLGVNAVLLVMICLQWLAGAGDWHAPLAQEPDALSLASEPLSLQRTDLAVLHETLERPLFSVARRPPPEAATVVDAPPQPDPLKDVLLLGVFGVGDERHLMLRAEGKVTRLKRGDLFGPWTVSALGERDVTFQQAEEQRKLELKHAAQPSGARSPLSRVLRSAQQQVPEASSGNALDAGAGEGEKTPEAVRALPPGAVPPAQSGVPQPQSTATNKPAGSLAQRLAERRARSLEAQ